MVATQLRSRKVLGLNQRQYEGLKTALQLNLRRQLLIAVCDNNQLQTQLVARLQSELRETDNALDDFGAVELTQLTFDPHQPDLVVQLVHWLKQAPNPTPHLQVIGLDAMTHQSMRSQNHFLRSLENIQSLLPHLESSLVLWLSWPWYRTLQQSAPEFWQWRSGVFSFVSEPVARVSSPPAMPQMDGLYGENYGRQTKQSADIWQILSEDLAQLERPSTNAPAETLPPATSVDETAPETDLETGSETSSDNGIDTAIQEENIGIVDTPDTATDIPKADSTDTASADSTDIPSADSTNTGLIDITTLENPLEFLAQREGQGATPEELLQAYRALSHHHRDRIEAGDITLNLLTIAIETFDHYLRWLPTDDEQRAAALNDLGTLHWLQAQHQSDRTALIAGMNQSAELYKTGLDCAHIDAETISRLYGNLGAVYSALANYDDSVTHLKQAVVVYRQALPFSSAENHPDEYGTLQNSLGSVYWKLAYYEEPKTYLNRAIAAYNEALTCHHPDKSPLDYAAVQNNLGIAYWSLSRYERPIFLLKHAIAAYRDALHYRTPSTDPTACASTYNNLGTAFWELANHPEAPADPEGRYKQNSVIAYEAALKASELAPSNLDLASIRHCLGSIYDKLAKSADSETAPGNLERALVHYVAALKETPKTAATYDPIFKALVRNVAMHYELLGLEGQQEALNKVPAEILPEVMLKL
ncbi:MAG: tetratricopeptide repeat protein [Cyanobacteria bacterium P01_A01_bin.137]